MTYTGDKKREYQRLWMAKRRKEWLDLNGPCIDCRGTDNLEVDHIDAKTKLMPPSSLWSLSDKNPKKIAELEKCVVRCNRCHKLKTLANRENAHHESHGKAKLDLKLVQEIRAKYEFPDSTIRGLAREYSVSRNTLRDVLRNKTWV